MDESKWPETENRLARFPVPLVDSEIASTAGYSWRSLRLDDRSSFELSTEMKLPPKQSEIPNPYMRAGFALMVHPELGNAELRGTYSMGEQTYFCNLTKKGSCGKRSRRCSGLVSKMQYRKIVTWEH